MSRTRCKVEDAIEEYALRPPSEDVDSVDAYLVARWTGSSGYESVGYRELSHWLNRQLLRRVYDEHGRSTTGTRVESEYEALTGDDELVRDEVVTELSALGIDAEEVVDAMVSPRTMHRHLTGCLDAEKSSGGASTDWERNSVEIARSQLEEKVAKAASSLASKGQFRGADAADIETRIYLSCPECATRVPFEAGRRQGFVCADHFPPPGEPSPTEGHAAEEAGAPHPEMPTVIEAVTRFSL